MKLWEVLKALEENPKKVFECDTGSRIKFFGNKLHWCDKNGGQAEVFIIMDKRIGSGICHNTGDFWQEVKQPVPWQEAIEAWANGKDISVENQDGTKGYATLPEISFSRELIKTGTWYIED